jgi:hypothetical protein
MILRIQIAAVCVIVFAGSWCLSSIPENLFWFSLSFETYINHVVIWFTLFVFLIVLLYCCGKKSHELENKIALACLVLCPINLLDYGIRSFFGNVGSWPQSILIGWGIITLLLPVFAIILSIKISISQADLKKLITIVVVPSLLLVFYALPNEFSPLRIERKLNYGTRPPIHFILFDMLSYEFLFNGDDINSCYPNFRSFSQESEVYLNAYSPGGTTDQTIPRLLTGIDFIKVDHDILLWKANSKKSQELKPLNTFETIFSLVDKEGYNVYLRGFSLPYIYNFSENIQSGITYPFNTLWKSGMHSLIWPVLYPGGIQNQKTAASILKEYSDRVYQYANNTFFYIHWNIPHDPFIFNTNGDMESRWKLTKELINIPDRRLKYIDQLKGTDKIFGKVIQNLKDSEIFEKSLIIIISDHNIKGFGYDMKRIPLLIKRPYQNKPLKIHSRVTTLNLKKYIDNYLKIGKCNNKVLDS